MPSKLAQPVVKPWTVGVFVLFLFFVATAGAGNTCKLDLPSAVTNRHVANTFSVGFRNDNVPKSWSVSVPRRMVQSVTGMENGYRSVTHDIVYQNGKASEFMVERFTITIDVRRRQVVSGTREFGKLPYTDYLPEDTTTEPLDVISEEYASCGQDAAERGRLMDWAFSAIVLLD